MGEWIRQRDRGRPMANGGNGERDERGRFAKGNSGGPGNPYTRRVAAFRQALMDAVSVSDIGDIARELVSKAKSGDIVAARVLLERLLGKAEALDILARIESLEERLQS